MILFYQNIANRFGKDIYAYHSNITFADMATVTFAKSYSNIRVHNIVIDCICEQFLAIFSKFEIS